jgi:hypothetical protein
MALIPSTNAPYSAWPSKPRVTEKQAHQMQSSKPICSSIPVFECMPNYQHIKPGQQEIPRTHRKEKKMEADSKAYAK